MSKHQCKNTLSRFLTQIEPQTLWIRPNESSPCEDTASSKLCGQYGSVANPAFLKDIQHLLEKYPVEKTVVIYMDAGTHGSPEDVTIWNRNVIVSGTGATTILGRQIIEPSIKITFSGVWFHDAEINGIHADVPLVDLRMATVDFVDCQFNVDTRMTALHIMDGQKVTLNNVTLTRSFYSDIPLVDVVTSRPEMSTILVENTTISSGENRILMKSANTETLPSWSLLFRYVAYGESALTLTIRNSSFQNGGIDVRSCDNSRPHISLRETKIESAPNDCAMYVDVGGTSQTTLTLSNNIFVSPRDDPTKSTDLRPLRKFVLKEKGELFKTSTQNTTHGNRLSELLRFIQQDESKNNSSSSGSILRNYGDIIKSNILDNAENSVSVTNNRRETSIGTIIKNKASGSSKITFHNQGIQNRITGFSGKFYDNEMTDSSIFIGYFNTISSVRSHSTPAQEFLARFKISSSARYTSKNTNSSLDVALQDNVFAKETIIQDTASVTIQQSNNNTNISSGNGISTVIGNVGHLQTIQNGNIYMMPHGVVNCVQQSDNSSVRSLESSVYAVTKIFHDFSGSDTSVQQTTLSNIKGYATDANNPFFRYQYDRNSRLLLQHQAVDASNAMIPEISSPDNALILLKGGGVSSNINESTYTHTQNPVLSCIGGARVTMQNSKMTNASPHGTIILNDGTHTISSSILQNVSGVGCPVQLLSNARGQFASSQLLSDLGSTVDGDGTGTVEFGTTKFSTQNLYVIQNIKTIASSASHFFSQSNTVPSTTTLESRGNEFA
jgi:hypothetical protein